MGNLNKAFYADEVHMQYPINTKEATLASYKLYKSAGVENHGVTAKFEKAAKFYDINLEDAMPKQAAAEPEMVSFKVPTGAIGMTKIASAEDVEKAAKYVNGLRDTFPRAYLKQAALYVLTSASDLDIELNSDELRKVAHIAGVGVGDRAEIEHEFDKRATLNMLGTSQEDFWKFSNEMKKLSDDDFYKQANLETICNVLEDIDLYYDNQHKYGSELNPPEDIVFKDTVDDLLKEASDCLLVPSIDATVSKKALLERSDAINGFFMSKFAQKEPLEGEKLLEKVANCDTLTAKLLFGVIEG